MKRILPWLGQTEPSPVPAPPPIDQTGAIETLQSQLALVTADRDKAIAKLADIANELKAK
jgi:hypothetical protein